MKEKAFTGLNYSHRVKQQFYIFYLTYVSQAKPWCFPHLAVLGKSCGGSLVEPVCAISETCWGNYERGLLNFNVELMLHL